MIRRYEQLPDNPPDVGMWVRCPSSGEYIHVQGATYVTLGSGSPYEAFEMPPKALIEQKEWQILDELSGDEEVMDVVE